MPSDTVCKTVQQHNQTPIPDEDMRKLLEIAADYCEVKNHVYARYSGIGGLSKLYPGYTIQNEMTDSGLRSKLNMPSVYFYLAVYDALGDIKAQWTRTKTKVLDSINRNENFTDKEKHYLRFLLKVSNVFEAVLSYRPITLKDEIQNRYELLAQNVDTKRLHNYLRRQVRKCRTKLHTDMADGFSISERAYRYADHGIYISTKEKRKRVFVSLTDNNRYSAQLYIKLYPEQGNMEIKVPVRVKVRSHSDYMNHVGLSVGIFTMLTTDKGNRYGERLGEYQITYADWLREQSGVYHRNKEQNPGRKKYRDKKRRYEERMHSYINQELNRFFQTEKPQMIYLPKLPKPSGGGINKRVNNSAALWQRGYIRSRLTQKCKEQSVEITEVFGKDISNECCNCGASGIKKDGLFICNSCGCTTEIKQNAARNAKKRGMKDRDSAAEGSALQGVYGSGS